MRRLLHILLFFLTPLLLVSCRSDAPEPLWSKPSITISVRIPAETATKAVIGEIPSYQEEKNIHRMQIWVFRHSDRQLIGYLEPEVNNLYSGATQQYSLFIEESVARAAPKVDVFVLANGEGLALYRDTAMDDLKQVSISGDNFGTVNPVSEVPDEGLPFSGMAEDLEMMGSYPVLNVGTVTITRTVSKVQLLLCRQDGVLSDSFSLEGIRLNGLIGAAERVFTTATLDGSGTGSRLFDIMDGSYSSLNYEIEPPENIPANSFPSDFCYRSEGHQTESAGEYANRIYAALSDKRLVSAGRFYFRETDKKLSGTISYRVGSGGTLKTSAFEMDAEGDFIRNHCWFVYAYFLGGKLYVKPAVVPWTAGHDRFAHITQGSVEMSNETYLRFDEDRKADTWNDSYVSVAYGLANGIPRYSPLVTLKTNNTHDLRLQVDNEDFVLIRKNGGEFIREGSLILIKGSSEEQTTEFYVIPASAETGTDPVTNVMLVEIQGGGMPPVNLPFNSSLPGADDHTTIRYRNIGAAVYSANQNNVKITGSEQNSEYWLESVN